jgi:hypothetical protein
MRKYRVVMFRHITEELVIEGSASSRDDAIGKAAERAADCVPVSRHETLGPAISWDRVRPREE